MDQPATWLPASYMDPEKAALMQMQIRNNASDLQDYLKDLETWETDVKKTDTSLSNQKSILKEVCY